MFDFIMKIAFMSSSFGPLYRIHTEAWWTVDINKVSYDYSNNSGFALRNVPYGKKSSDEKTLFWYHLRDAEAQLNLSSYTYYCEAIG